MQPLNSDNQGGASGKLASQPLNETLSDAAVVERVLQGDVECFEVLMRRYNQRVYRVVRGMLGNDHEAEDVVQDAYVRAYQHLHQFEGRALFSTWLTRIAINEANARLRKLRRRRTLDSAVSENDALLLKSSMNDASNLADIQELRVLLIQEIESLPTDTRIVLVMRLVEGLSTSETAECLEITEANVRARLHRARSSLRKQIDARIGKEARQLYQFDGSRCDAIVANVLQRVTKLSGRPQR